MKELKIEVGEDLDYAIRHFANVGRMKKLKVEININANGANIPNKIEIDVSEELKGYIHRVLSLIEGKERS